MELDLGNNAYNILNDWHTRAWIYLNNTEINIGPINDLVPLCANCHRMIQRDKYNVLTVEDLKKMLLA